MNTEMVIVTKRKKGRPNYSREAKDLLDHQHNTYRLNFFVHNQSQVSSDHHKILIVAPLETVQVSRYSYKAPIVISMTLEFMGQHFVNGNCNNEHTTN